MKRYSALLIVALLILLLFSERVASGCLKPKAEPVGDFPEDRFWEHPAFVAYSRHARCRMECRHIDEQEVAEILKKGAVNTSRIRKEKRGTTYPLEGITRDKQRVRIVVAQRANGLEVVTCIDLDTDWPCDCP